MLRAIAKALPLQAVGIASVAVSMLLTSRFYGPAAQGDFAYFKSIVEFCAPLLMLGAPQSLLYFVRSGEFSTREGVLLGFAYAPLIFVATLLGLQAASWALGAGVAPQPIVLVAACAACFGLSATIRGVALANGSHVVFGLLSCVAQAVCLLLIVSVAMERVGGVAVFYVAGWAVSAALAATWGARALLREKPSATRRLPALAPFLRYGFATYVPIVTAAASLAVTYALIDRSMGKSAVGAFSIAVMAQQMVVMPIALIAPSLFYSWTAAPGAAHDACARVGQFGAVNRFAALYALLCCFGQWLLLDYLLSLVLGPGFEESGRVAAILMIGYLPACLEAVSLPLLYAAGHPRAAAIGAVIKGAVVLGGQLLLWPADLSRIGVVWAVSHWMGWLALLYFLHTLGVCRFGQALGLSAAGAPGSK